MALPTLITVQGTYLRPDGTPDSGSVTFGSTTFARHGASDDVVAPGVLTAELTGAGEISLAVPATDDPAWSPVGWTYRVTVQLSGVRLQFDAAIPYDAPGGVLDLSELLPAQAADGTLYAAYAHTHADYAALAHAHADYAALVHAHGDYAAVAHTHVDYAAVAHTHPTLALDSTVVHTTGVESISGPKNFTDGLVVTDRFRMSATGGMDWGPVGGAFDLNMYRAGAGTLQTDYTINAAELKIAGTAVSTSLATLGSGVVRASDHGLSGWTFPTVQVQAGTVVPTAGLSHIVRLKVGNVTTITNILMHLTAGGSVLTSGQCFASLHTDAGVILGAGAVTASLHSTGTGGWGDGGAKTLALTTPQTVTPNTWYKVRFWFNGTTGPTLSRGVNSSSAIVNIGLAAANSLYSTADAGLTTAGAAPGTIGTQTGSATAWWVGLS